MGDPKIIQAITFSTGKVETNGFGAAHSQQKPKCGALYNSQYFFIPTTSTLPALDDGQFAGARPMNGEKSHRFPGFL